MLESDSDADMSGDELPASVADEEDDDEDEDGEADEDDDASEEDEDDAGSDPEEAAIWKVSYMISSTRILDPVQDIG